MFFKNGRWQRWLKFISGGILNTGITYLVYLTLNLLLSYQVSYFLAYATGIIFAYWFNATYVFRVQLCWSGLFAYPLVYLLQYAAGAIMLGWIVEHLGLTEAIAPLVVAFGMLPVTYLASKTILLFGIFQKNKP